LWLFGGVAEDIVNSDPLVSFDLAVATGLHDLAIPPLTTFFLIVTALGSVETIALVGLVGTVGLGVRRHWLHLGTWLAAVAGSAALNQLLKALFGRPRPYFEHPLVLETSYSSRAVM
jgi:undecaprenyl-diphosphatase